MSFVSYAQNFEDVILARVFRGLGTGFYIDVGAQDPRIDSVTKAFYEQGWHGINLEPVESWCEKLRQDRPRDINLCVAAGAAAGVIDFHEVVGTGLSTSSDEFARRHQAQGHELRVCRVPVRTLDAICAEHEVELVHFLKVDAEGDEAAVLRGIDLARLRPWVILVEATEPNSRASTHAQWEPLLLERGYDFVLDDGLNRFYLATEHSALAGAFATPPNVFDDFVLRQVVDHENHEQDMATHISAIEDLSQLRAEAIERLEQVVIEKEQALARYVADQAENHASLSRLRAELAEREANLSALHDELLQREAILVSVREHAAAQEAELQARATRIAGLATRLQGSEQAVASLSRSLLDAQASWHAAQAGWVAALADHRATLAELAEAQRAFQEIVNSRSWRLTAPLRRLVTSALDLRARWSKGTQAHALVAPPPGAPDAAAAAAAPAPPAPAPRTLPLTEDAEQILARCPVLDPARIHEGAG